ncbi:MAG: thioredoxin family protein [Acidobacteriota bacterium]
MDEKAKVSCLNCGATNNFPLEAAGKQVVCGRCRSALPVPGSLVELTQAEFEDFVQKAGLPILLDVFSPTCAPCLVMHPIVERLAQRRAGELMVVRLNADTNPGVGPALGIQGVPTFILYSRAIERGRMVGAIAETDFSLWVASRT